MGAPQSQPGNVRPRPIPNHQMPLTPQYCPYMYRPTSVGQWSAGAQGKLMKSRNSSSSFIQCGITSNQPPNTSLEFTCPFCQSKNYDGGLCKKIACRCGKILIRNERDEVQ